MKVLQLSTSKAESQRCQSNLRLACRSDLTCWFGDLGKRHVNVKINLLILVFLHLALASLVEVVVVAAPISEN